MATKLEELEVTKVAFVDEGANPDAHIKLFKKKGEEGSNGFPETEGASENSPKGLARLFASIAKGLGFKKDDLNLAMEEIEKSGSVTFGDEMRVRRQRKIADEIWDICFALNSSLASIMCDDELDVSEAQTAMEESLDEFVEVMKDYISQWSNGKTANIAKKNEEVTEQEVEIMKRAVERLNERISKASQSPEENGPETEEGSEEKGESDDMKIDKSKMTEAERAFYEAIEKKYGEAETQAPAPAPAVVQPTEEGVEAMVAKALQGLGIKVPGTTETETAGEGIYKGMSAEAKAELEELKKFKQEKEEAEIREVAKRYTILGKTEEELFPVLKSLKETSQAAYDTMVQSLDSSKEAVEKSGIFREVGKSGHGTSGAAGTGAWAQAEQRAAEIMKGKNVTKAQALDEVFMADPELAKKCDQEG